MLPKSNEKPQANAQNPFSQINRMLFVKNLNYKTDRHQLEEVISMYNLESCYMILDKMGFSLGRALLTFRTQADALQAMCQSNGSVILFIFLLLRRRISLSMKIMSIY